MYHLISLPFPLFFLLSKLCNVVYYWNDDSMKYEIDQNIRKISRQKMQFQVTIKSRKHMFSLQCAKIYCEVTFFLLLFRVHRFANGDTRKHGILLLLLLLFIMSTFCWRRNEKKRPFLWTWIYANVGIFFSSH